MAVLSNELKGSIESAMRTRENANELIGVLEAAGGSATVKTGDNPAVLVSIRRASLTIGSSGAVASHTGDSVSSATYLGSGIYQILLSDNTITSVEGIQLMPQTILDASPTADGSFSVGSAYRITSLGNTDWTAAGLDPAVSPAAVGVAFVATSVGGAGTGTAKSLDPSTVFSFQQIYAAANPKNQILICLYDDSGSVTEPGAGQVLKLIITTI